MRPLRVAITIATQIDKARMERPRQRIVAMATKEIYQRHRRLPLFYLR